MFLFSEIESYTRRMATSPLLPIHIKSNGPGGFGIFFFLQNMTTHKKEEEKEGLPPIYHREKKVLLSYMLLWVQLVWERQEC